MLNHKKAKFTVVNLFRINDLCYSNLTLGRAELEEIKSLRILRVTLDSKLTFKAHLQEVVSKTAMSLGVVRRAGKLFDCPHVRRVASMHMFCSYLSFVPPSGCRLQSLI